MRSPATPTPQAVMREVTEDIIRRAIRHGRKKQRTIYISKSANGRTTPVESLNPDRPEARQKLDAYLTPIGRHYTISGLGAPEEGNAINWRTINLPLGRRILLLGLVTLSFVMKGTPLKSRLYRLMGVHVGRNVEIMQMAWLDHFRPELIFIGAGTGIGPILIEDGVRTLPGTTLSPYLARIRAGAVVGYAPPPVKLPEAKAPRADVSGAS